MEKALLVGINEYSNAPLRGCINDCLLMYKILSEYYEFNTNLMRVLTDNECTKKNILENLKWLISDIQPGDTVFFHYSGHGSQVVADDWTNTEEADGRDEILCPIDLDWNDPLRGHELGALFNKLPRGVKILIIIDACHSGTGLRNSWKKPSTLHSEEHDWVNRFLPPPPSNILSNPKIRIDNNLNFVFPEINSRSPQTQKKAFLVETVQQGEAILISGCQENQTSADAWLGNRYHGALSYTLAQTLIESNRNITYQRLITVINRKLDKMTFTQNPQLECKREYFDKKFLS